MPLQEKNPSIKIGCVEETQEETKSEGIVIEGKVLYALIAVVVIAISTVSYNAYTARSEANRANVSLKQQKASSGAKIEKLLNTRTSNMKEWSELEAKQEKLNISTSKIEQELTKYNISVIQ